MSLDRGSFTQLSQSRLELHVQPPKEESKLKGSLKLIGSSVRHPLAPVPTFGTA